MALLNSRDAYGTLSKILHWVLVILLLMMILGGLAYSREWVEGLEQVNHERFGKTILALAVVRLALRLIAPAPKPNPGHATWEIGLAHTIHWSLYIVLFLYPLSGWFMVSAEEFAMSAPLPYWLTPYYLSDPAYDLHIAMKWVLLGLVGLHIAGALKHAVLDRDGTLKRMWFGKGA